MRNHCIHVRVTAKELERFYALGGGDTLRRMLQNTHPSENDVTQINYIALAISKHGRRVVAHTLGLTANRLGLLLASGDMTEPQAEAIARLAGVPKEKVWTKI